MAEAFLFFVLRRRADRLLGGLLGDLLAGLGLLDLLGLGSRLGDEHGVDVGEDTALGDGHAAEELVELLVVADGQLDVAGGALGFFFFSGGGFRPR